MMRRLFFQTVCMTGLMFSVSACQPKPLTAPEQQTMTRLTTNMKTHCVGRYLIDLPADVDTYGSAKLRDIDVKVEAMSQPEFLDGMHKREKELNATKSALGYQFMYGDAEYPVSLSSTETLRKEGIWHFISLGSDAESSDANRVIEAYKWSDGYRLKLQREGSDFARSRDKDKSWVQEMSREEQNDVPRKLHAVLTMLYQFRGLSEDEIPSDPGVCLTGGFIRTEASDEEEVSMSFYLRDKRDVSFDLETNSNIQEKTTLLQRGSQIEEAVKARDGHTVRKGKVNLPGLISAQEWLLAGITDSKVMGHKFSLEANSTVGSAQTPLLILDMDNGVFPQDIATADITQASLTEGEAVALWDAVSRTIRLRPGAMDPMPMPVFRSITTVPDVSSGEVCPETGQWGARCNGQVYLRDMTKGQIMPLLDEQQQRPYRWLPQWLNAALEQRNRLPLVSVAREVSWYFRAFPD